MIAVDSSSLIAYLSGAAGHDVDAIDPPSAISSCACRLSS